MNEERRNKRLDYVFVGVCVTFVVLVLGMFALVHFSGGLEIPE